LPSEILKAEDIHIELGGREILKGINLSLPSSSFTCIAGPNGAGKSVFLSTLAGYFKPKEGRITALSKNIHAISPEERACIISFLPQRSSFFYPFRVKEVVEMGSYRLGRYDGQDAMESVGVAQFSSRRFTELSEGERKLVLIARLLAQKTPVLILDEPASNLDIKNQIKIYSLLERLTSSGKTVLASEHSLALLKFCHKVNFMKGGRIIFTGKPEDVLHGEKIEKIYGLSSSELSFISL